MEDTLQARHERRIDRICEEHGIDPSSVKPNIPAGTTPESRVCISCPVCRNLMRGHKRTVARHLATSKHLMNLAQHLSVDYETLCPPPLTCKHCTKIIPFLRPDILIRHERTCRAKMNRKVIHATKNNRQTSKTATSTSKKLTKKVERLHKLVQSEDSSRISGPVPSDEAEVGPSRCGSPYLPRNYRRRMSLNSEPDPPSLLDSSGDFPPYVPSLRYSLKSPQPELPTPQPSSSSPSGSPQDSRYNSGSSSGQDMPPSVLMHSSSTPRICGSPSLRECTPSLSYRSPSPNSSLSCSSRLESATSGSTSACSATMPQDAEIPFKQERRSLPPCSSLHFHSEPVGDKSASLETLREQLERMARERDEIISHIRGLKIGCENMMDSQQNLTQLDGLMLDLVQRISDKETIPS